MGNILELNAENFSEKISTGISLVDFFATWCGPCQMLGPELEKLAEDSSLGINIYKVDIDKCGSIASQYGIMSVPTMILFKDSEEVNRIMGFLPKDALFAKIKDFLPKTTDSIDKDFQSIKPSIENFKDIN